MRVFDLKLMDASEVVLAAILNENGRPLILSCSFHEPSKVVIKDVYVGKDPEAQA